MSESKQGCKHEGAKIIKTDDMGRLLACVKCGQAFGEETIKHNLTILEKVLGIHKRWLSKKKPRNKEEEEFYKSFNELEEKKE